jgi:hypothetical protein
MNSSKDPYSFLDFFLAHGYHLIRSFHQKDQYMERLNHIQRIFTFQHPHTEKKIQLITVDYHNLLEYISDQFDLSVCMTWWNGEEDIFETLYPMLTDRKQMFVRQSFISHIDTESSEARIQKYIQRGFEIVNEPPPCLYEGDPRLEQYIIKLNISAFDVWQYDDVICSDHLKESLWNILMRVGENWYSFERKALSEYMEEHRCFDPHIGSWYDTPHRQTISHDSLSALYYRDFCIFRLIDPFSFDCNGVSKTVYTVEAYSVSDWDRGIPTHVY